MSRVDPFDQSYTLIQKNNFKYWISQCSSCSSSLIIFMALNIPLDKAAIVSTVLEGILYGKLSSRCLQAHLISDPGFSLLMFCATVWSLTHGRIRSEVNKLMFSAAILLLVLSTTVSVSPCRIPGTYRSTTRTTAHRHRRHPNRARPCSSA
jgi:hypothetical protein